MQCVYTVSLDHLKLKGEKKKKERDQVILIFRKKEFPQDGCGNNCPTQRKRPWWGCHPAQPHH